MADEQLRLILEAIDKNVSVVLSKVNNELDKTGKSANVSGDFLEGFSGQLTGMLSPMALGAAAATALGAGLKFSTDQAAEAEVVQAKLSAVLAATGGAAGMTQTELNNLADELSRMSGVDDDLIVNAEAVLLTFRSIGRETFPEAAKAALNLSMILGTDLQSATLMVGKAMNEPIQGVGALRRAGVQLTDQQEEMVKQAMAVNDIFSAQQIIMGELNHEVGGVAEKMGDTYTGNVNRLKVSLGNLGEAIGKNLLPELTELTKSLTETSNSWAEFFNDWAAYNEQESRTVGILKEQGLTMENGSASIGGLTRATREQIDAARQLAANEIASKDAIAQTGDAASKSAADLAMATAATKELSDTYKTVLSAAVDIAQEEAQFTQTSVTLANQRAQVELDLAQARAQGYWETSEKVQGYQNKLIELDIKIADSAAKHNQATNQMIYEMTLAKLSVDGLTDAEFEMAQQTGVAMGIFTQAEAEQAIKMNDLASAVANGRLKVDDLGRAINMLPNSKDIDVILKVITQYDADWRKGEREGFASGTDGWQTVPPGYDNDSYPISLSSGEKFAVIPNNSESLPTGNFNSGQAMSGAQFVFHAHYQPMFSLASESELEAALYPAFLAMLDRAKSDGQ